MAVTVTRTKYDNVSNAIKDATKNVNIVLGAKISSQAKVLAPVDYGQLRNSISASSLTKTVGLNDNNAEEQAEPLKTTGLKGNEVFVGSNSDHTIYQEYGTVKQPAQPFLRPATELIIKNKSVESIMSEYSREAMEAEFKKRKETINTYGKTQR